MKTKWRFTIHPLGLVCLLSAFLFIPIVRLSAVLLAAVIHEAAHLLTMQHCGIRRCTIEWTPFGFVAQADNYAMLCTAKRIAIAASGLIASACTTIVCCFIPTQSSFMPLFINANAAMFVINAMPVLPLDGGRVIVAIASILGWENGTRKLLLFFSYIVSVGFTLLGVYGSLHGSLNPTLLVLGPYLAYAAKQNDLHSSVEGMKLLEAKMDRKRHRMLRADLWVTDDNPDALSMVKALRLCPEDKKLLLLHIDAENGAFLSSTTEEQILVKLMKDHKECT